MFKSIKTPLSLTVVVAVLFSIVIVTLFAIREHEKSLLAAEKRNLNTVVRVISEQLRQPMMSVNDNNLANLLSTLSDNGQIQRAVVFDIHQQPIASYVSAENTPSSHLNEFIETVPTNEIGSFSTAHILVSVDRIGDKSSPLGYLMVAFDASQNVIQSRNRLLFAMSPFLVACLVLTIGVALFFMRKLLRPLYSLTTFTQTVGEHKKYSMRFFEVADKDTNRLANNINRLLDTIEVELTINDEQNQTLIEQQQTMMRLANYDSLTGLPNRQFVMENVKLELSRARKLDEEVALLYFDLDGFKSINDTLGHETGDLILIEVADRVTNVLREGDLVARLGGDEFLIVPDRDVSDLSLKNLADRLIAIFAKPFPLRGLDLNVGVSIGIAKAKNANYELSQLMSNADLAMYRSKNRGRGIATIFTPDMVESHKRKIYLANSIDRAVSENEFQIYYQPKVSKNGMVVGLEALIRWQHPDFGMVMPDEFIPIAEQGGKISAITRWVMERVCIELPELRTIIQNRFLVAINLSGHDLRHSALFDQIHDLFERYHVNPSYVEFEVTESAYLENFAFANKFFRRLSNMGCAISLDDFGTGYSSLSYLTQITIDTLKIDRQFISELETSERSRLVTGTIIDLAKRLSLTVCAEGIEKCSQWDYLLNHGCDHVQGYLFSRPIPINQLRDLPKNFRNFLTKGTDIAVV